MADRGIWLPVFMSGTDAPSRSMVENVADLLDGENSALIAVDGSGNLPAELLAAARGTDLQMVIILRPGGRAPYDLIDEMRSKPAHEAVVSVRVVATAWGARHPELVLLSRRSEQDLRLVVATGDIAGPSPSGCGVALEADDQLGHDVQEWFLGVWSSAAPLSVDTPQPPEWPRASSSSAAEEWESFRQRLQEHARARAPSANDEEEPTVALSAAEDPWASLLDLLRDEPPAVREPDDEETLGRCNDPRSVVGVRQPPSIEREAKALYGRGRLVTVNVAKIPTYKLNVVEALELPPRSKWGRASATSPIQLDLLPHEARPTVDQLIGEAKRILNRHSFKLDDNQRWMPNAVHEHFVNRLDSMPLIDRVDQLLGMGVHDYVDKEMDSLLESLDHVLRERRISVDITSAVKDQLKKAAVDYLEEHATVAVRATHSREALVFLGGAEADYERPLRLLLAAGLTTRERLANPGSEAKRETEGPPLETMDVVGGDGLLHLDTSFQVREIARRQLAHMKSISPERAPEDACAELIAVLRSTP